MINLLIIEDNMEHSKKLINLISANLMDVKLYRLSVTGKDAIDTIASADIDIILLNLSSTSGIDVLNYISQNGLTQYQNSIVILASNPSLLAQIPSNAYAYIYHVINKPIIYQDLLDRISEIAEHKSLLKSENQVRNKINKELQHLKFNFSYNGTRYLAETILELYNNRDNFCDNLKQDIFPILAQRHRKTINTIAGNIKQSINCMYFDCDEKLIVDYFNYAYPMKPKMKEICFTILNKLL